MQSKYSRFVNIKSKIRIEDNFQFSDASKKEKFNYFTKSFTFSIGKCSCELYITAFKATEETN